MIRKVIYLALLVVLLMFVAIAPGLARPTAPMHLRIVGPETPVQVGQPLTVNIYIDNASNLGSFEFEFVFDSATVSATPADLHLADFLGSTGRITGELRRAAAPPDPDRAIFGAYSYGPRTGPNGSGLLATVTMTALAAGSSPLTLEGLQVTDIQGLLVDSTYEGDSIEVSGESSRYPLYLPVLLHRS